MVHKVVSMAGDVGRFDAVDETADAWRCIGVTDAANAVPEYDEIRKSLVKALGMSAGRS